MQSFTAVCILIFSLYLQTRLLPFRRDYKSLNSIEIFSLLVCRFTFMGGLYLNDEEISEAGRVIVSVLAVSLISFFTLFFLYNLYWKIVEFCLLTLQNDGVEVESEGNGIRVIVMWILRRFKRVSVQQDASMA